MLKLPWQQQVIRDSGCHPERRLLQSDAVARPDEPKWQLMADKRHTQISHPTPAHVKDVRPRPALQLHHHMPRHGVVLQRVHAQVFAVAR